MNFKKVMLFNGLFLSYICAFANDGIGYSSGGGIVLGKTEHISMKKEVLNLSYNKISVDYEFLNESNQDLEEVIIFPLPKYTANYGISDAYYGEPNNFSIHVNGKKVDYTTQIKAFNNNKDITATLKSIGLNQEQIAYYPMNSPFNIKVKPLSKIQFDQLKKMNLLEQSANDESFVPTWSVEASYIWKQKFPANKILNVHHEYAPFVSAGPGVSYIDKDVEKDFCMDKSFKNALAKIPNPHNLSSLDHIPVYQVSYILKTANSWKNGIEDFTLNINKGDAKELVSLCFPGTFKKINNTTLQVHLKNFKPQQDLLVFFANYKKEANSFGESRPIKLK